MDKSEKERKKKLRRAEAEKKRKIRELEAEIEEMQIDHAETFGYAPPVRKRSRIIDTVLFSAGTLLLAAGLLLLFLNSRLSAEPAIMKIGAVRFSRTLYSLPLIVGIIGFFLFEKKKIPVIITMAGFAAAFTVMLISVDFSRFSESVPIYVLMICFSCAGLVLLVTAAVRIIRREKNK